jgi:hypothetical protein
MMSGISYRFHSGNGGPVSVLPAMTMLIAACGLLGGCDNTRASPAGRVIAGSPSRQSAFVPGVASHPPPIPAPRSHSDSHVEDFDADGIADMVD